MDLSIAGHLMQAVQISHRLALFKVTSFSLNLQVTRMIFTCNIPGTIALHFVKFDQRLNTVFLLPATTFFKMRDKNTCETARVSSLIDKSR